jgi:hypothetical protein
VVFQLCQEQDVRLLCFQLVVCGVQDEKDMTSHNELYERARDAIRAVSEDVSVPDTEVVLDLLRLRDDIDLALTLFSPSTSKNEEDKC